VESAYLDLGGQMRALVAPSGDYKYIAASMVKPRQIHRIARRNN